MEGAAPRSRPPGPPASPHRIADRPAAGQGRARRATIDGMDDDDEPIDLADWPAALDAYRTANDLARRTTGPDRDVSSAVTDARAAARRELARLRSRLPLRGLDPASEARIRAAIDLGEADGRAEAGPRW